MVRKRAPGRPGRDTADLRGTLLDAALACYTRNGVAAASVKAIAEEAGVTPALLHYYFGNREQLLAAVVDERVLPLLQSVQQRLAGAGDDIGILINTFIAAMGDAVAENPWWPALWVREVLSEGGALRELLIAQVGRAFSKGIEAKFARAQRAGRMNPDLDPRLLIVSLLGLTLFPAAGAPVWRLVLEADDISGEDLQKHAHALLSRGLELRP